ncbi:hypothetical protein Tco_0097223, partial [Tanacetum coccineum]
MLWGIVTQTNVDHAELLWEEFTQGIQTFFSHKASHKASLKDPKKKAVPLLIPYGRFTKMIIYYLGSTSDVHKRPESPCHLPGDDFLLGNLKFISKGETDEVFGMAIPKQLITQAIQQSSYYPKYLEMVAKNTKKTPQDSASKQPEPATKRAPPKKPTTTTPVKPTKPPSSKQPKSPSKKPSKHDEAPQEPVPQGEGDDPDRTCQEDEFRCVIKRKISGQGKAIVTEVTSSSSCRSVKKKRTMDHLSLVRRDQHLIDSGPHNWTPSSPEDDNIEKWSHDLHQKLILEKQKLNRVVAPKRTKKKGEVASSIVTSGVGISVRTEDQAGSDLGKAHEALVGPDPEPMQEDQTGSDSRKEKSKVIDESDSTIPDPSHQTVTSTPPRKHDSDDDEDDDDNEGPSTGSNQGKSAKRKRPYSGASGSTQPPLKDDDQSSKKPWESDASASKQHPTLTSTGWQITDTRDAVVDSLMHRSDPESKHSEQSSDDIPMQDEGRISDLEDTDNAHIPKVSTTTWFKPIPEGERPATPEPEWTIPPNDFPEPENNWANTYATTYQVPTENKLQRKTYDIGSFIKWFCRRTGKKKLCKADLEGPAFNLVKAFHKNNVFLQYQMDECHKLLTNKVDLGNPEGHQILRNIYEPLPLGGPPGQVTIQPQFFFNKDLDYLLTGDKERKIALSISKLKAARYLDFGLEELVPSLWVESEREYDISAVYGITHWWFRRKEFYINKHSEPSDREAVRSQMRILSVISVKVFEKYGYNYLREIILRRADYQEYKISEKDFKNLHPNDFEDLFLLNIQEKLNHLPKTDKTSLHTAVNMWIRNLVIRNRVGDLQLGIESYQTKINLERPNWDATDYYFKEDYTIVPKPRAVVYRDRNDQRKLMRLNELHKFSDGTLTRVMEKLD